MQFVSFIFIVFVIFVLCCYYVCPVNWRKIVLFTANMVFYYTYGIKGIAILSIMIIVSYFAGNILDKKKNRAILFSALIMIIIPLLVLNYGEVFTGRDISFIHPVGLSFFTFKMISYIIENYKGSLNVQYTLLDYAVYISFFPTITSGPIDRPERILKQIQIRHKFDEDSFLQGFLYVLWGYFQKMILADRLAIIVNAVYADSIQYAGVPMILTSIFYTLQIYFDFAGYTYIALGIARMLGYTCQINFRQPYFSTSIKEFWQRWHISLSTWLRDYIYIPLGGNRKGTYRKYVNILITFLVSGFWHGVGLNYVIWGLIHGVYQIVGACTESWRNSIGQILGKFRRYGQVAVTFLLVNIAWVFFRSTDGFIAAINRLYLMFNFTQGNEQLRLTWLVDCGVTKTEMFVMLIAFLIVFVVDVCIYREKDICRWILSCWFPIRIMIFYILIFAVLLFGIYGPGYDAGSFIYFQF